MAERDDLREAAQTAEKLLSERIRDLKATGRLFGAGQLVDARDALRTALASEPARAEAKVMLHNRGSSGHYEPGDPVRQCVHCGAWMHYLGHFCPKCHYAQSPPSSPPPSPWHRCDGEERPRVDSDIIVIGKRGILALKWYEGSSFYWWQEWWTYAPKEEKP